MDAASVAMLIGGLLQPYVQEFILRNRLDGQLSLLATATISFIIATLSTWLLGGFSDLIIPQFTLQDPSPLIGYMWLRFASVFALSQLVFNGTRKVIIGPIPIDVHEVAGTVETNPTAEISIPAK